jgi:hypothetical protein
VEKFPVRRFFEKIRRRVGLLFSRGFVGLGRPRGGRPSLYFLSARKVPLGWMKFMAPTLPAATVVGLVASRIGKSLSSSFFQSVYFFLRLHNAG